MADEKTETTGKPTVLSPGVAETIKVVKQAGLLGLIMIGLYLWSDQRAVENARCDLAVGTVVELAKDAAR